MKALAFGAFLFFSLLPLWLPRPAVSQQAVAVTCPRGDPLRGVYDPSRLRVLSVCVIATGYVTWSKPNADGDTHLELLPSDTSSQRLLNAADTCWPTSLCGALGNRAELVLEIVPTTLPCAPCTPSHPIPPTGAHVRVWGPLILDVGHGWNEIHPLNGWASLPGRMYLPYVVAPAPEGDE